MEDIGQQGENTVAGLQPVPFMINFETWCHMWVEFVGSPHFSEKFRHVVQPHSHGLSVDEKKTVSEWVNESTS